MRVGILVSAKSISKQKNKDALHVQSRLSWTIIHTVISFDTNRFIAYPATDPIAPVMAPAKNFMYTGESGLPAPIASLTGA